MVSNCVIMLTGTDMRLKERLLVPGQKRINDYSIYNEKPCRVCHEGSHPAGLFNTCLQSLYTAHVVCHSAGLHTIGGIIELLGHGTDFGIAYRHISNLEVQPADGREMPTAVQEAKISNVTSPIIHPMKKSLPSPKSV